MIGHDDCNNRSYGWNIFTSSCLMAMTKTMSNWTFKGSRLGI